MTSENGQPSFPQSKLLLLKFKAEALIPETKTYEKSTRSTHADLEDLSKFSTYVKTLGFNHSRPFCKASTAPISQGVRELRAEISAGSFSQSYYFILNSKSYLFGRPILFNCPH